MTSLIIDDLIGQMEIFDSLELQAAEDYALIENELTNPEMKEIVGQIRVDERYHSKMCREIIDALKNRIVA